jgi:hypothetical protein
LDAIREKPSPNFSGEGLIFYAAGRYFLQQPMLQHCLPLQQFSFGAVAAVAVPINAARLRIKNRYFIILLF